MIKSPRAYDVINFLALTPLSTSFQVNVSYEESLHLLYNWLQFGFQHNAFQRLHKYHRQQLRHSVLGTTLLRVCSRHHEFEGLQN